MPVKNNFFGMENSMKMSNTHCKMDIIKEILIT